MVDHQNKRQGSLALSSGRARSVKLEEDVDVADGFQRLNVAKLEAPPPPQVLVDSVLAALVEDMECCVCLDVLVSPVLTPCGHTLCERDLADWRSTGKSDCPSCRSADAFPAQKNRAIEAMMDKWLPKALSEECLQTWIKRNAAWARDKDATLAAAAAAVEGQAGGGHHRHQDRHIAALPERQREGAPPPFDRNDIEYQRFLAQRQRGRAAPLPMFGQARPPNGQQRLDELHRILGRVQLPVQHQVPPNRPRTPGPAHGLAFAEAFGQLNAFEGPARRHGHYAANHAPPFGLGFRQFQALPPVAPRMGRANFNFNVIPIPLPPVPRPAAGDAAAAMRAVDRANRHLVDAINLQAQLLRAQEVEGHFHRLEERQAAILAELRPLPPRPAPIQRPPPRVPAPAPDVPAQDRRRAYAYLRNQGPAPEGTDRRLRTS